MAARVGIVVPCFNEERRLQFDGFMPLLGRAGVELVFVNDGSRDGTLARLDAFAAQHPGQVRVVDLAKNQGKAEAVRAGLNSLVTAGVPLVGYLDADLATPAEEMLRIVDALENPSVDVSMGSRVALLGRAIERTTARHYLGRIFASGASIALGLQVYDTQCGAKVFRVTDGLRAALSEPFSARWAFDVELLGRLLFPGQGGAAALTPSRVVEVPLHTWRDVKGSKLNLGAMIKAGTDVVRTGVRLRRR